MVKSKRMAGRNSLRRAGHYGYSL